MKKKLLTPRFIESLKPEARCEYQDEVVPHLILRCSPHTKAYALLARFPGSSNPTRRSLGKVGTISLRDVRLKAQQWLQMIEHGKDPAIELERERLAEARKRADSFETIAKAFTEQRLSKERQGYDAGRLLQRFVDAWDDRPIVDIERRDIRAVIDPIAARAPYTAHYALGVIRRLFSWCVDRDILQHSPCEGLKASAQAPPARAQRG
jgi:Arm DNA-binding domain